MISELASQEKVIGVKQSRKAIREGRAKRVYLACVPDQRGRVRGGRPLRIKKWFFSE